MDELRPAMEPAILEAALTLTPPILQAPHSTRAAPARKILFIARGGEIDGSERQTCNLIAGLDRRRFVPLVLLDCAGPFVDELRRMGTPVHILPLRPWRGIRGAFFHRLDARRATALARRLEIDLIHATYLWKAPYAAYIARRLGIPSVADVRGPLCPRDLAKHKLREASTILTISLRFREELLAWGIPPERITIAYDCVDTARFHPSPAAREAFRRRFNPAGQFAIGFVGRIEPFKRVLEFLEMLARAQASGGFDARCFLIGAPGGAEYMRRVHAAVCRLGLSSRVVFTGRLADAETILPGLDLLVTLSGGSVMFEAMACGVPVLSVRDELRPAINIRHGETAWCVVAREPAPPAEALLKLIAERPLREALAKAGREWVEDHMDIRALAAAAESIYERLLAPAPAGKL